MLPSLRECGDREEGGSEQRGGSEPGEGCAKNLAWSRHPYIVFSLGGELLMRTLRLLRPPTTVRKRRKPWLLRCGGGLHPSPGTVRFGGRRKPPNTEGIGRSARGRTPDWIHGA